MQLFNGKKVLYIVIIVIVNMKIQEEDDSTECICGKESKYAFKSNKKKLRKSSEPDIEELTFNNNLPNIGKPIFLNQAIKVF